jgi:hypothetical protein
MDKKCTKTIDVNKRSCTDSHPDENPNFTLKLSRSYVEGQNLRLVCFLYFFIVNGFFLYLIVCEDFNLLYEKNVLKLKTMN